MNRSMQTRSFLVQILCLSFLLGIATQFKGNVLAQSQLDPQNGSYFLYLPLTMKNFQPATIVGRVTVQGQGAALAGAQVCTQNGECAFSDASGNYRLYISAGWKQLLAQKPGYIPVTQVLQVPALETRAVDFALLPDPGSGPEPTPEPNPTPEPTPGPNPTPEPSPTPAWWAKFSGTVKDAKDGSALGNVSVCTHLSECATTEVDGSYTINLTALGQREVTARTEGYLPLTKSATALINQNVTVDFNLSRQWQGAWIKGTVIDAS